MKRRVLPLIMLIVFFGAFTAQGNAQSDPADGTDYESLTDQIEIMRRVWTRALSDQFTQMLEADAKANQNKANDDSSAKDAVPETALGAFSRSVAGDESTTLNTGLQYAEVGTAGNFLSTGLRARYSATSETRGLYIPGHGVVYSTNIQVPLTAVSITEQEQSPGEQDAWDEASEAVGGNSPTTYWYTNSRLTSSNKPTQQHVLDERYVNAAIDMIVQNIAMYGNRIDQLAQDDSITVAVRLNPTYNTLYRAASYRSALSSNLGGTHGQGRLVIEIPHSLLGSITDKGADLSKIKSQCRITRY